MNNEILNRDIRYLKGVGEQRARLLNRLGADTTGALLFTFPRDYIDFSNPVSLADAPQGAPCTVRIEITAKRPAARLPGGRSLVKVYAESAGYSLDISFFNNPYTPQKLEIGNSYVLYGRFTGSLYKKECVNPILVSPTDAGGLYPIYPATEGLASRTIANIQKNALALVRPELEDTLPEYIVKQYSLMPLMAALDAIHFPKTYAEAELAKRRFAFEQVLNLALGMSFLKAKNRRQDGARFSCTDSREFWASLPFTPTDSQLKCSSEISADLASGEPMNRLLQGDVGSGKTAVAAAAVYCAYKSGYQSAFMAPSEILAAQHAETLYKMLSPFGVKIALLTSAVKGAPRKTLLASLANGEIGLLVGTHALLGEKVAFNKLGLVVTDEQHRFGVEQRAALSRKGQSPHTLFLSATPIPRSLALVIYGELDISTLDTLPAGRKPIKTFLVNSGYRPRYLEFVRKNAAAGFGTYIVCPLVEDSEAMAELESAESYCKSLKRRLPELRVALIHGRIKSAEKNNIINSFAAGEVDVLVSTTVIEVGVDISHATIMIIENAERYGLSELHQLRGRVGRRGNESYCILVSDSTGQTAQERLKFLCRNTDGFKIAQYDLEQRGPGEFFGKRQHGLPELRMASALGDGTVIHAAYAAAGDVLKSDSGLTSAQNEPLRRSVEKMFGDAGMFN